MTKESTKFGRASRRQKVTAFLIDHFIFTYLMITGAFIIMDPNFLPKDCITNNIILLIIILWVIIYFSKDIFNGISLGKWINGTMIRVESNGNTPSITTLFIRNLFVLIWPIKFLVVVFSEDRKRIVDNITKTIIVNNPNKSKTVYRITTSVGVSFALYFFATFLTNASITSSKAYKISIEHILSNAKIENELGKVLTYESTSNSEIKMTNGHGNAIIEIAMNGTKSDTIITCYLVKEPKEKWQVIALRK